MLLHGTSWNPKNLNPAYVASVDAMVRSPESMASTCSWIRLVPGTSRGPLDSTLPSIQLTKCANGVNSGATATRTTPISISHWEMTGWFGPRLISVVSGLEKYMPDRLVTIDWVNGPPDCTSDGTGPHKFYDAGHRWVNLDAWYEYHAPQWATWYHYHMVNPVMPTCIFETLYEGLAAGSPKHIPTPPD